MSTSLPSRTTGVVKFFSVEKGYGFIVPDNGDNDVFVHKSSLPEGIDLNTDQRVSYVVSTSGKKDKGDGRKAIEVKVEN